MRSVTDRSRGTATTSVPRTRQAAEARPPASATVCSSTMKCPTPLRLQGRRQAGGEPALRRPDAAGPRPESPQRVGQTRLERDLGDLRQQQRQERMGRGAAQQLHDAAVPQRPQHGRAAACPPGGQQLAGARSKPEVVGGHGLPVGVGVEAQFPGAHLPQPRPRRHVGQHPGVVQLGCQDGRDPQREHVAVPLRCQGVQLGDQRHVGLGPGLVQPLLAQRPDPVAGKPWQVRVQDEAERPGHGRSHKGQVCRTPVTLTSREPPPGRDRRRQPRR